MPSSLLRSTLSPSPAPPFGTRSQEDQLARQSDVIVSTNVTLYAEYKGFFTHLLAAFVLVVFSAWALIPSKTLHSLGIDYYPDKYWSQAIPAYSLMAMLFVYIGVALYVTEVKTMKLDDLRAFTDEHLQYPERPEEYLWKAHNGVWDLPVGFVNEVLYGDVEEIIREREQMED